VTELTLRTCGEADAAALRRLAERDSASVPAGTLLAAEAGGELIAAISLGSGRVIADPFRHSADAVELLRRRRAQIGCAGSARGLAVLRAARLRGRAAPAKPA
jgi:hypothetical protein